MNPSFPETLPITTANRLRAVADILRAVPEMWDQNTWMRTGNRPAFCITPRQAVARFGPVECGTNTACIAGWALLLTPDAQLRELPGVDDNEGWQAAGQAALGLQPGEYVEGTFFDVASMLFSGGLTLGNDDVAEILDVLADIPEHKRSWVELAYKHEPLANLLAFS